MQIKIVMIRRERLKRYLKLMNLKDLEIHCIRVQTQLLLEVFKMSNTKKRAWML